WEALHAGVAYRRVDLPSYPFERERFWLDTPRAPTQGDVLIGQRVQVPTDEATAAFPSKLGPSTPPYLQAHVVFGEVVFPAAAYLELAFELAAQSGALDQLASTRVDIDRPWILRREQTLETVLGSEGRFQLFVRDTDDDHQQWLKIGEGELG